MMEYYRFWSSIDTGLRARSYARSRSPFDPCIQSRTNSCVWTLAYTCIACSDFRIWSLTNAYYWSCSYQPRTRSNASPHATPTRSQPNGRSTSTAPYDDVRATASASSGAAWPAPSPKPTGTSASSTRPASSSGTASRSRTS
ncbi:unnamed protein product [Acanthoscelides obtectus]|uniref:Uncharacterized protein n=1 Tax=Acanthoscelides obtectus TaxID=200917 RepID=A0A9P0P1J0_ACAOB|nr:unnamed protein product [Acanthoscelides obtectus]CAK1653234.1 hypothetical protein AOBTE_LOCUS18142 [Acanthoscelides obtectus]